MPGSVEFFFDFVSPMSYFGFHRVRSLRNRLGCELVYKPFFLGAVLKAVGMPPPATIPAKRAFYMSDTQRHAKRFDLPWAFGPHFPLNTLTHLRMAAGLDGAPNQEDFIRAVFHHMWGEPKNIADETVTRDFLTAEGFDAGALIELGSDKSNADVIRGNTEEAIERGVFGAPTFFVGGEMFFGQDRLDFVEDALTEKAWSLA